MSDSARGPSRRRPPRSCWLPAGVCFDCGNTKPSSSRWHSLSGHCRSSIETRRPGRACNGGSSERLSTTCSRLTRGGLISWRLRPLGGQAARPAPPPCATPCVPGRRQDFEPGPTVGTPPTHPQPWQDEPDTLYTAAFGPPAHTTSSPTAHPTGTTMNLQWKSRADRRGSPPPTPGTEVPAPPRTSPSP